MAPHAGASGGIRRETESPITDWSCCQLLESLGQQDQSLELRWSLEQLELQWSLEQLELQWSLDRLERQ